jgi:4-amino-4-deoxy-L-arabinose transferase-like glycosyltransferase
VDTRAIRRVRNGGRRANVHRRRTGFGKDGDSAGRDGGFERISVSSTNWSIPVSTATLTPPPLAEPEAGRRRRPAPRPWRSRPDEPAWARPALLVLLAATAALYLWNLSASGYANDYYAAAVQAGTQSVKAWLFGSLDAGNAITVDKPPAALWVMTASARIFGFSSWSLLVPQALEGVAAVGLLYGAVRRWAGVPAGLLAGAALALTPAAVLMFRFDNPDALLTLLLVAAAYAVVRATDAVGVRASTWWLVAAGVAVGFGFLTKMGQALLVVPALGLVYLVAGPTRLRTRLVQLLAALGAMVVSAGWFIALVELWPAADRPYIGGSTTNSLLELALGYNGIGRLLGGAGNGGGGGGGNAGFGGAAGITRLFTDEIGLEISWLLPAALILLVAVLWISTRGTDRKAGRTDRVRAAMVLWGGWTLVTGLVFSFMSGTMHPYYTVALAPGIAALVGVGGVALWRERATVVARLALALAVAATGAWSFALLAGSTESFAWVRWIVAAAALVGAACVLLDGDRLRMLALAGLVGAVLTGLLGTGAYAVATAATPHSGSIPAVGTSASAMSGPGGPGGAGAPPPSGTDGAVPPRGGGMGVATSSELTALLANTDSTWSAAVATSQSAASLELASGTAVMSLGGWSGSDATVTLARFQELVAAGQIHYYVGGGQGGPDGRSDSTSAQIAAWVEATYPATTVGDVTVYDLTK